MNPKILGLSMKYFTPKVKKISDVENIHHIHIWILNDKNIFLRHILI